MKVVFDTNILVSAFATEGLCARLLIRANRRDLDLIVSPVILEKFTGALEKKIGLARQQVQEALRLLREASKLVDPANKNVRVIGVCRDEADHAILEAALAGRAEIIVTGDRELLALKEFRKIRILTPREFELLFE